MRLTLFVTGPLRTSLILPPKKLSILLLAPVSFYQSLDHSHLPSLCKGKKGKGGKWNSKRKAPDELWTEGVPPDRTNPLIVFLADKLPREYLQVIPDRITNIISPGVTQLFSGSESGCLMLTESPARS